MTTGYEGMTFELANCESTMLREIADPQSTRKTVAMTYGLSLRSSEHGDIDWKKVNEAIIARWSRSALEWIKKFAWKGPVQK